MNETFEPSLRIKSFQLMAGSSLHSFPQNFTEQQTVDGVKVGELMWALRSGGKMSGLLKAAAHT